MSSTSIPSAPQSEPRRAFRSPEGYVGGVASGLAEHLGVPTLPVRLMFVVTGLAGFGLMLYAGLWLFLPMAVPVTATAPGLDAARRQGRRPGRSRRRLGDAGPLVALATLALGLAGLVGVTVGAPQVLWPAAIAVVGLVVLWRQADEAQRERWLDSTGRVDLRKVVLGAGGAPAWTRLVTGVALLASALLLFAFQTGSASLARDIVLAGVLGVVGLGLTLGPWLLRLATDLSEERAERVRSQERADVAAHLHDSVLQTLALIQKNAADPRTVATLARSQERALRSWLFDGAAVPEESFAASLRRVAAEVEDAHGVPVEVVTVGDLRGGEAVVPLLQAAREAISNSARHSGAAKVDVYAEVAGAAVEVFVRDRGRGFDPAAVDADRLGVRRSIVDRMQRHGGTATVRSAPGEGTEVRLALRGPTTQAVEQGQEHS